MSILEYYTLNDCCTGEPVVINAPNEPSIDGQILYLTYVGDCFLDLCPNDLQNVIITNVTNENHFNYIEENSATIKYIEVMKSYIEKTKN